MNCISVNVVLNDYCSNSNTHKTVQQVIPLIIEQVADNLGVAVSSFTPINCGFSTCLDINQVKFDFLSFYSDISISVTFTLLLWVCLHLFYCVMPGGDN